MKTFSLNESQIGKVGILLCVGGHATININGKSYVMTRGIATVVSPLLMLAVEECDDDFEILPYLVNIENMVSIAQNVFTSDFPIMVLKQPVMRIADEDVELLLRRREEFQQIEELKTSDNGSSELRILFEQSQVQLYKSTFLLLIGKYYSAVIRSMNHQPVSKDFSIGVHFILSLTTSQTIERRVSWYAEQAHLSVGHFSSLVRKVLGQSPQYWIEMITINKAKSLLKNRDKSIKEIAQEMGFPEQFTFRKYFKEHAGLSPTDYRKPQLNEGAQLLE